MDDLPAYINCDDCGERHYLIFNRDIQGKWTTGYQEFVENTAIHTGNGFETIDEAVEFLKKDLNDAS